MTSLSIGINYNTILFNLILKSIKHIENLIHITQITDFYTLK